MNFNQHFDHFFFDGWFAFKGEAGRDQFWTYQVIVLGLFFVACLVALGILAVTPSGPSPHEGRLLLGIGPVLIAFGFWALALFSHILPLCARRMRDIGHSPWLLIFVIPIGYLFVPAIAAVWLYLGLRA